MTTTTRETMTRETTTREMSNTERSDASPWWKTTWPLDRWDWLRIAFALVGVVGVGAVVGLLFTDWFAPNAVTRSDVTIAERLVDSRTPARNDVAPWAAFIADSPVKIAATAVAVGAMLWRWRRWHEAVFVGLALIFEASAFMLITSIVQRPRPDVERLLESTVSTSFPSGHAAAATVYAAFAVVVFWHTRNVLFRVIAVLVCAAASVVVGSARLYQGMHYLSDVVGGIVLGIVSVVICYAILGPPSDAAGRVQGTASPNDREATR